MTLPATRRTVLLATGGAAAALTASACSKYGDSSSSSSSSSSSDKSSNTAAGRELARTTDIPVGGGKIFADEKVVVTQPTKGDFKAFSAVCTHQGCTVSRVADGIIHCPCHQSEFRIADGSVAGGPAPSPLPAEKIRVDRGSISLA